MRTLEAVVNVIEKNLSKDEVVGIPEPFRIKIVEERTKTSPLPRVDVLSTPVHSSNQPAYAIAQYSSSLVSVWDFSVIEDVVNSFLHQTTVENVTVAAVAPPVLPYDHDMFLTLLCSLLNIKKR